MSTSERLKELEDMGVYAVWPEIIAVVDAAEAGALSLNYAESHGHSPYDGNLDKEELFEGALKDVRVALAALDAKLAG